MELRAEKVVNNLPATLTKNTVYFVKVGAGFDVYVTNDAGTIVSYPLNYPAAPSVPLWLILAANSTVSTTAFANVAGLSFSVLANKTYIVELIGAYQTAVTTTGIALALSLPAGAFIVGYNEMSISAVATNVTEQIVSAATTGVGTGVRAANTNAPIWARWVVRIGATAGTVQLMQRSEVAASNTVLQANLTVMSYLAIN